MYLQEYQRKLVMKENATKHIITSKILYNTFTDVVWDTLKI